MCQYWDNYYRTRSHLDPSPFAISVEHLVGDRVLDLGCGDGRDCMFFADNRAVIAVDQSFWALLSFRHPHIQRVQLDIVQDIMEVCYLVSCVDTVYTRFFLHAIAYSNQHLVIDELFSCLAIGQQILLECRSSQGEVPDDTHPRWLVESDMLRFYLNRHNIEHEMVERCGLATVKNEDPVMIRVIGCKK
jgi:hypothetical protein